MANYANILVALDFSPVAGQVLERATELAKLSGARLYLLHIVEYFPPMEPMGDIMLGGVDWGVDEQELLALAKQQFRDLLGRYKLSECDHEVSLGNARTDISRCAVERKCDLIVIGSHGRHGLGRLLGSTVDAVLHHAHCDVLAVRAGA